MNKVNHMIGKRFGRLVVIASLEIVRFKNSSQRKYLCKCDCGNEVSVLRSNLICSTKSCGCLAKERVESFSKVGKTFGRLTVISKLDISKTKNSSHRKYLCKCSCGAEVHILNTTLNNKSFRSCGCFNRENKIKNSKVYGMSKTKIYRVWIGMKRRCNNINFKHYSYYGGRGITYDKKWEKFEGFFEDMGESYKEELTLERINCNGNYCKENCAWIPLRDQARNTRRSRYIEYKGKKLIITEWARLLSKQYGTNEYTIRRKLYQKNESISGLIDALTKK